MPLIFHEIWFKRLLVCRLLLGFSEWGCTWPRWSLPNIQCFLETDFLLLLNIVFWGGGDIVELITWIPRITFSAKNYEAWFSVVLAGSCSWQGFDSWSCMLSNVVGSDCVFASGLVLLLVLLQEIKLLIHNYPASFQVFSISAILIQ